VQVNHHATHSSAIWVVEVATGSTHSLSAGAAAYLDEAPSWFPDGRRIALQSNRTGTMEVWTMATDGSDARQVTGRAP
jgi:Tol biopolymer transport system component